MKVRELVRKYNSFVGDENWMDNMDIWLDTLTKKQSRKMFLSMFKATDREGQRIWRSTKRFMQAGR